VERVWGSWERAGATEQWKERGEVRREAGAGATEAVVMIAAALAAALARSKQRLAPSLTDSKRLMRLRTITENVNGIV
jgi:hypothetical protein